MLEIISNKSNKYTAESYNRLTDAEERISNLEDKPFKIFQSQEKKRKGQ